MDYWNGLLEWTLTFFFFSFPQELHIYTTLRNLFSLTLPHAGLACKVELARAVPRDSTRVLDFIMKPRPHPTARDDPLPNNIIFADVNKYLHLTVIDTQMTVL